MLLSKAWASFEADKRIEGFSPQTLKAYQVQHMLLIGYFMDVEMEFLDNKDICSIKWKVKERVLSEVLLNVEGVTP